MTPEILFSSFPECHSALRASLPEFAESNAKQSGEKPSPLGRRCPSGRMRGGGKHRFQALTHCLQSFLLSRRARVHGSIMDSATPPWGCTQNDSIAWGVQESNGYDGWVQSCSSGADSSHLTLPACAPQRIQGWGGMFSYISKLIMFGVAGFAHVSSIDP